MTITEPYSTMLVYLAGAFVTLAVLIGGHKPKHWTVDLVPEHTIEPGNDILVPVGSSENHRRMRVVSMVSTNRCMAIDIKDQQHHIGLAMGLATAWPVMLPLLIVIGLLTAVTSKAKAKEVLQKPRPRQEATMVADCMKDYVWKP